jgi:hypothetical protein
MDQESRAGFAHNFGRWKSFAISSWIACCQPAIWLYWQTCCERWFLANAIDAEQSGEFQIAAWIFPFPQRQRTRPSRSAAENTWSIERVSRRRRPFRGNAGTHLGICQKPVIRGCW